MCDCVNCKCFICGSTKIEKMRNTNLVSPGHYKMFDSYTCECGANHLDKWGETIYELGGMEGEARRTNPVSIDRSLD